MFNRFGPWIEFYIYILCIGLLFFILKIIIKKYKQKMFSLKKEFVDYFFIMYIIGLIIVTFSPTYFRQKSVNLIPFYDIYYTIHFKTALEIPFLNIILFIPLSFILLLKYNIKPKKIIFLGFLISLIIETLQYFIPLGRITNIDDIILNTLGVIIGVGMYNLYFNFILPNFKFSKLGK